MSFSKKVTITITISILIFTSIVYFSFSSGFDYIESNFFNKKIAGELSENLKSSIDTLDSVHQSNLNIFNNILGDEYVINIFDNEFTDEQIIGRDKIFKELNRDVLGFDSVRIISLDGKRIHYSNDLNDIRTESNEKINYLNLNQIQSEDFFPSIQLNDKTDFRINYLEETNQFLYSVPFVDQYDRFLGISLFYVSNSGFKSELTKVGLLSSSEEAFILRSGGVLFNLTKNQFELIKNDVNNFWSKKSPLQQVYISQSDNNSYMLFSEFKEGVGYAGRIINVEDLKLTSQMKYLLLITLFFVIVFINFLILNIKQDKYIILQNRIKKFQIQFLQDYVVNKSDLDWVHWQEEIKSRKKQVHKELIKNLGSYGNKNREEVDRLINSGWDNIIEVISSKIPSKVDETKVQIDADQIEEILERVLAKGVTVKGSFGSKTASEEIDFNKLKPIEVEDYDSTEDGVDDLEDTSEELEDLDSVEELDAADEIDFSKLKPIEVEDYDSTEDGVDDLEDTGDNKEDLEPVEELEELEDLEPVEELEELEELEGLEDLEPVVELEELEDLEPVEELEDTSEDLEDLEDIDSVEETIEDLEELDDIAEDIDEAEEVVEDLEPIDDIYMFDSPDEIVKKLQDTLEMEDAMDSLEQIPLSPYLPVLNPVKDHELSKIDLDDMRESYVTVEDFDLNVFSPENEETEETESYGTYGYNFDQYLEQFPTSSAQLYKSVLKISKDFNTHAAAISQNNNIIVNLAVSDKSVQSVITAMSEGFLNDLITRDLVTIIRNSDVKTYKEIFDDGEGFNEIVIIPIKYKDINSELILFFNEFNNDVTTVLDSLNKNKQNQ